MQSAPAPFGQKADTAGNRELAESVKTGKTNTGEGLAQDA